MPQKDEYLTLLEVSGFSPEQLKQIKTSHPYNYEITKFREAYFRSIDENVKDKKVAANLKDCFLNVVNLLHPQMYELMRMYKKSDVKIVMVSLFKKHQDFVSQSLEGLCEVEEFDSELLWGIGGGLKIDNLGFIDRLKYYFLRVIYKIVEKLYQRLNYNIFLLILTKINVLSEKVLIQDKQKENFEAVGKVFAELFKQYPQAAPLYYQESIIDRIFDRAVNYQNRLKDYLLSLNKKLVIVVGDEFTPEAKLIISLAKELNFPTINLIHGAPVTESPLQTNVDYTIVENKRNKKFLTHNLGIPEAKLIQTGSTLKPRFQDYQTFLQKKKTIRESFFLEKGIPENGQKIITHGSAWYGFRSIGLDVAEMHFSLKSFFAELAQFMKSSPRQQFVFLRKPHPGHYSKYHFPIDLYEEILSLDNCEFYELDDLDRAVSLSDLYIAHESTSLEDAFWHAVPTVSLAPYYESEKYLYVLGDYANVYPISIVNHPPYSLEGKTKEFVKNIMNQDNSSKELHSAFHQAYNEVSFGDINQAKVRFRKFVDDLF
jgi:hypothetical protein